ncbi:MAG: prolyl oligopeptidase family serine peptidase [Bifidobacterium tibiigranuli]|jgi:phospholipase/carboxylesterase|nr:prolyl oligopeptidase family serine peptidase [Bifidobacterium tibiigranuli]
MRFTTISSIETDHRSDANLYVMFHGYGNDESEMIRMLGAIDPDADYMSVRGPIHREYLGGNAWYDSASEDAAIRERCSAIGDEIVDMLDATVIHDRPVVSVGFSQGGYLAYRLLAEHPDVFDAAVLLSPSYHDVTAEGGEGDAQIEESLVVEQITDQRPRVFLGYGELDARIPAGQRAAIEHSLARFADMDAHMYSDMGHDVCAQELADVRRFLTL